MGRVLHDSVGTGRHPARVSYNMKLLPLVLVLAYQDQPTFRSEVALVHVDAEVRVEDRLIDGLAKEDFRITDNGKPREILYFGHTEEPLDVILLFDTSASMYPVVARVAETARAALDELRQGDRVAVMAFDADTDLILDFTKDFAVVEQAIRERVLRRHFIPNSQLQKGLNDAALHFLSQRSSGSRRAVLAVTDNLGSGRASQALRNLWEADAVAAGLVIRNPAMTVYFRIVRPLSIVMGGMSDVAERTGGDMLNADDAGSGFRQMIQRLRQRYSLHYAMPESKPGEQRKIRVELSSEAFQRYKGAKVHARSGYVVAASPPR